ncbi:MAG: transcription-repair coupling factor [Dehalococcoidia bacterium]
MNLAGLLKLIRRFPDYNNLVAEKSTSVTVIDAARPALLASLYYDLKLPMLVIVRDVEQAKRMADDLSGWCGPEAPVHLFPEFGVLPYEQLGPDSFALVQRLRVLGNLNDAFAGLPPLVTASVHALSQKTISPSGFKSRCLELRKGYHIDPRQLMSRLADMGYEVVDVTETAGQASRRGGIVDLYSPNNDRPARIEFFGNEVEGMRWFDPVTQCAVGLADSVSIIPAREMVVGERIEIQAVFEKLELSRCSKQVRDTIYEDMGTLLQGQWHDTLHFYTPLFNRNSIIDHFPADSVIVLDDPEGILAELDDIRSLAAGIRENMIQRGELPPNFPDSFFDWPEMEEMTSHLRHIYSLPGWSGESNELRLGFGEPPVYGGRLSRFLEDVPGWLKNGHRIIVVSQQAERIGEVLGEQDIPASTVSRIEHLPSEGSLTLVHGSLSAGWSMGETLLLTDTEIFGLVKKRRPTPARRSQRESFVADLAVGDYVVHVDHGVARFLGMTHMLSEGKEREYLILEYADDGRLYVPSDQVERVARYVGSGGYLPSLSRLHTHEWGRTKERVKKATMEIARELLAIYASRQVSPGIAFGADTPWEQELAASFPYEETPDQRETILDVKSDMQSPLPMDRLVCGDVGYGKTEVAVRAAFKAVNGGMQVAVLVPTTVLAQQHLATFTERLGAFPVEIEMLSRFRSAQEQRKVLEGLDSGLVDICIGTHRLIQRDVSFRNLGLVIIDEEQKFGVVHKERLKKLRSEVDVLTLSATPIPRSLHLSLIGVRDMSTIETAPEARLPIRTQVSEYNDEIVRAAILRELDRGSQVFFVHNRVQSINAVARHLQNLVPEARMAVAHGQMPEDKLEAVMVDFMKGQFDVLVCTTIIESGLDLPSANTLIVNQADKLGLTQLYHLRGRVGRGDVRAYAYLLYEKGKRLTAPAQKRLRTIFEATELGAGFRIAMKDLEIRGAGNILGAEQSGHVGAVGFDLYCRLLAEAVEELKAGGEKGETPPEPTLDLPLKAYIPEDYVADLHARLALYQRIARIDSPEQSKDMWGEFRDRYGEVPREVENLLYGVRIKLLATKAGISRISTEGGKIILTLADEASVDRAFLQRSFGSSLKVGSSQLKLNRRQLGDYWMRILEEVLGMMAKNDDRQSS